MNEKNENINKIQNNNNQISISKKETNIENKSSRNLEINHEKNINHYKSSKNAKDKNIIDISKVYFKLIYEIEKNDKVIRIFGNYFVKKYSKINCGIIFDGNIIKLKEYFEIKGYKFNKLEIEFYSLNDIKDAQYMFYNCISLLSFGIIKWESLITDLSYMFYGCEKLILLVNISEIKTENLTNMSYMFYKCNSLKEINISSFNTTKVTKMKYLFNGCKLLKKIIGISNLVSENVEEIQYFFCDCSSLEEICSLGWNTKSVKYLNSCFKGCHSLRDIKGIGSWNTSNITEMEASFKNCYSLEDLSDISKWDVSKVITTKELFYGCVKLKTLLISHWKFYNLKDCSFMFAGCDKLNDNSILIILNNDANFNEIFKNCFALMPNGRPLFDIYDKNEDKKKMDIKKAILKKKKPK